MHKFRLGKLPARHDSRIPHLRDRMNQAQLPTPTPNANWYASQAMDGIPLLGNGHYSNCCQCSIAHYIAAMSRYVTPTSALVPTEKETLKMYSDMTGFNPNDPSTDNGTYFMGPGSAIEHWWQHGVVVGGKLNKPSAVAHVDFTDQVMLRQAIKLFGFVFIGATLRQDDMDSPFMWRPGTSAVVGGHEFLLAGYTSVANEVVYDIITWNGMWRCTDKWIAQAVDEAAIVFNRAFFDVHLVDPGGIAWAELARDMGAIGHA